MTQQEIENFYKLVGFVPPDKKENLFKDFDGDLVKFFNCFGGEDVQRKGK